MSDNRVWVTWKSDQGNDQWYDMVDGLQDAAIVDDLRKAFVNQRRWQDRVDPATLTVSEKEDGAKLKASKQLAEYFTTAPGSSDSPGRSEETALYVDVPNQQQMQQQDAILQHLQPVVDFATQSMENATVHKPMSNASVAFASELLMGYGVSCVTNPVIHEEGSQEDPPPYVWTVVAEDNEIWSKTEHGGTGGACVWFKTHLMEANDPHGLKVATGSYLPELKANRRRTSGKGDVAVGILKDMNVVPNEPYLYAKGLIELKTNEAELKTGQNMLELMALSTASSFGKAVALLATNCSEKWEVFHFSDAHTVQRKIYTHGRKAWEDYAKLIRDTEERIAQTQTLVSTAALATHDEEQDIDGFDFPAPEQKKMKAMEDHAMLERVADYLGDKYGERPVVPVWARVEARCPDYYA